MIKIKMAHSYSIFHQPILLESARLAIKEKCLAVYISDGTVAVGAMFPVFIGIKCKPYLNMHKIHEEYLVELALAERALLFDGWNSLRKRTVEIPRHIAKRATPIEICEYVGTVEEVPF